MYLIPDRLTLKKDIVEFAIYTTENIVYRLVCIKLTKFLINCLGINFKSG